MDANREAALRLRYTTDDVARVACARCGGDGVNRTTRHLNQNGDDAASDFQFVPCWMCQGQGWTFTLAFVTEQACREALRLEEELAGAFPSRYRPRPSKKAVPITTGQDETAKARTR